MNTKLTMSMTTVGDQDQGTHVAIFDQNPQNYQYELQS